MVAVAPTCTFAGAAGTISDALPPAGPAPCLPTEFSAAHRDMASWALWLFLTTLIRTLMSTHRILYPHILLIGVTSATLIRMTAWAATWRHWPWASTRVMPFIIVAGRGFMVGARVRVTGTGGVVGSRPCRKIIRFRPQQLIMMDRDKSALHAVQPALDGERQLDSPDPVLTDLRTPGFISSLFGHYEPTIILSAADLKHPTLTERPLEGFLTNGTVTRDLLGAARQVFSGC